MRGRREGERGRTCAVEAGQRVFVGTFCGEVTAFAETANDRARTGLGERSLDRLLGCLLWLGLLSRRGGV
jgi:hypothetical protein